jgi:hypothetical protein
LSSVAGDVRATIRQRRSSAHPKGRASIDLPALRA